MILDIVDVSTKNASTFYIISEECKPGGLDRFLLDTKTKLPEDKVLKIFAQVVMVLEELHTRRVLHKKLQLGHVLLASTDHDIKVCSLGSCRMMGAVSVTDTNNNRPRYSSPSMLKKVEEGEGEVIPAEQWTFETDLWALGVLLAEMVSLDIPEEQQKEKALTFEDCLGMIPAEYKESGVIDELIRHCLKAGLTEVDPNNNGLIDEVMGHAAIAPIIKDIVNSDSFAIDFKFR